MAKTFKRQSMLSWVGINYFGFEDDPDRELHRFFSNSHSGHFNAPAWFRRKRKKRVAAKNKQALFRCLKEDYEFMPIPEKHDANWYYF